MLCVWRPREIYLPSLAAHQQTYRHELLSSGALIALLINCKTACPLPAEYKCTPTTLPTYSIWPHYRDNCFMKTSCDLGNAAGTLTSPYSKQVPRNRPQSTWAHTGSWTSNIHLAEKARTDMNGCLELCRKIDASLHIESKIYHHCSWTP